MENYELDTLEPYTQDDVYDDVEMPAPETLVYDDGYIEQEPRWTRRRVILFIIAMIVIVAMVIMFIAPWLQTVVSPVPGYIPPPATPPSQL